MNIMSATRTANPVRRTLRRCFRIVLLAACILVPCDVGAADWFVASGGRGNGSSAAPFGHPQDALDIARGGDTIIVRAGAYTGPLQTVRDGSAAAPIRLRADGLRGSVIVSAHGLVLAVRHRYISIDGIVFDGQYGPADTITVATSGSHLTLRNVEVRRSSRDLIDMAGPERVTIDGALLHHALNAAGGRTDAHGIVAGPVRDLLIRNTEIHTFSGDGIQLDPGRAAPGWTRVTLEGDRIWLAPLATAENGFAAGTVPGENAVDTKAAADLPRTILTIRDVTASGFRGGLISNMAAFNLKEHVDVTVDRVTVFDSEIAFRLRGAGNADTGAWVRVSNAVIHDVRTAFRYENDIRNLRIWNTTIGGGTDRAFQQAASPRSALDVRNVLIVGETLAREASGPSNRAVTASEFVDGVRHDYRLAPDAAVIDAGVAIAEVSADRNGVRRPQGRAYDIGAYESVASAARIRLLSRGIRDHRVRAGRSPARSGVAR
jgi:hypothetical protein